MPARAAHSKQMDTVTPHQIPCPADDLAGLRLHLEECPNCRADGQRLIDFAVELLLSQSQAGRSQSATSTVVVINYSAARPQDPKTISPRFSEFAAGKFEPDVARHLKPSGRRNYGYLLRKHVFPVLGHLPLAEITFDTVQNGLVRKMLDAGYAVQTVKHVRNVTSAVFRHAIRTRDYSGLPPTHGVRLPQMKRKEKYALNSQQARAVLDALESPYRAMAFVSMTTSMNLAEMCALRWARVNLSPDPVLSEGEIIPPFSVAVRENFYQGTFGSPKTINRRRCVALPMAAVKELDTLRRSTPFPGDGDIVFATRKGTPKHASNLRRRILKPVGQRLGIPWLNWHCFRNTFATLGEQLGVALSDRQAQMGHGAVWMTQEYTVSEIERRRAGAEMIAHSVT